MADLPGIEAIDILIEQTPVKKDREKWQMNSVKIWDSRKGMLSTYATEFNHLGLPRPLQEHP